jgi:hypothetical protein
MANTHTPFVRSCVALWLAGTSETTFCVADVIACLKDTHTSLEAVDLSKAVSNELVRLEYIGKLVSHVGKLEDGCGVGRPPRVYARSVCPHMMVAFQQKSTDGSLQQC